MRGSAQCDCMLQEGENTNCFFQVSTSQQAEVPRAGKPLDEDPSYKSVTVLENTNGHISDSGACRGISGRNIHSVKHACCALLLNIDALVMDCP